MKKLFALVLALAMILAAVPALADNPLDRYTTEELQTLSVMIQAEILNRSGEPFELYPGEYEVGTDIPAGSWRVEYVSGGSGWFYVYTLPETAIPSFEGYLSEYEDVAAPVIGKVTLKSGQLLEVSLTVRIVPYTGIQK